MKWRTDQNQKGIYFAEIWVRIFSPFGKNDARQSFMILLNYDKKVIINSGVAECQNELEALMKEASLTYSDIDAVINVGTKPENFGLNSVIQHKNPKVLFYASGLDIPYIENVAKLQEEKPLHGFFKLIAGNTEGVLPIENGASLDLGGEKIIFYTHTEGRENQVSLYLAQNDLWISPNDEQHPPFWSESPENKAKNAFYGRGRDSAMPAHADYYHQNTIFPIAG